MEFKTSKKRKKQGTPELMKLQGITGKSHTDLALYHSSESIPETFMK